MAGRPSGPEVRGWAAELERVADRIGDVRADGALDLGGRLRAWVVERNGAEERLAAGGVPG